MFHIFVKKEITTLSAHQHKALCPFKIINLFQTQPVFTGIHNNLSGLWGKLCMNSYVLIIQKRINTEKAILEAHLARKQIVPKCTDETVRISQN